jgi:hypothetical protein
VAGLFAEVRGDGAAWRGRNGLFGVALGVELGGSFFEGVGELVLVQIEHEPDLFNFVNEELVFVF